MRLTEKVLQRILVAGTALSLVALVAMSSDSLRKVKAGRTPALSDAAARGKHVWNSRNCNDCHTVLGIGGYFAPELTRVLERRDTVYLARWLLDPRATKPGTTMPPQRLTDAEARDLVAFLVWVRGIDTNGWPPLPATGAGGGAMPGRTVMEQKGCFGCHVINGYGTKETAPDLSHIGSTRYDALPNTPDFLDRWIDNPAAQKPGTMMPHLAMTPAERADIVSYLETLR